MTYRGIVRGKVIELEGEVVLPEGTEVEVVVKERQGEGLGDFGGLGHSPTLSPGDVDALLQAIEQGKRPVRFEGVFDQEERKR